MIEDRVIKITLKSIISVPHHVIKGQGSALAEWNKIAEPSFLIPQERIIRVSFFFTSIKRRHILMVQRGIHPEPLGEIRIGQE